MLFSTVSHKSHGTGLTIHSLFNHLVNSYEFPVATHFNTLSISENNENNCISLHTGGKERSTLTPYWAVRG